MTTICIDWYTGTLYTDSRVTQTTKIGLFGNKTEQNYDDSFFKIWRTEDPYHFYTGTGCVAAIEKFIKTKKNKYLKNSVVWEIRKGKVISHRKECSEVMSREGYNWVANGSGAYCLQTALSFTCDTTRAMKSIADTGTGGKIHTYPVDYRYKWEDVL